MLQRYEETYGIASFDLAVDFGWFWFLTKPIFQALHWANGRLGNFGLAILALTVVIKLIFFPLANKSYKSMAKMRMLQPKMMELRERYGEDKQRLNQEMMTLYKKEGANPLSGCLPILIRSEEHTSELQSLMRISYAVFSLKKTNNNTTDMRQ